MGAGGSKAHEAYTVAPSPVALLPSADAGPAEPATAAYAAEVSAPADHPTTTTAAPPAPAPAAQAAEVAGQPEPDPQAAIPIPATVPAGELTGTPLLVGGADLDDSLATLVAYQSPDGPREVLHAQVTQDAEAKLLEAVALSDEKKIPVAVTKEVHGRLPLDETNQLYEQLETVAKSVNHHLKAGDGIPEHTKASHAALTSKLEALAADPATTADEQAMLGHYAAAADQIAARLDPGFATPYADGGKLPQVTPHTVASTVTVTELIPAPAEGVPDGLLAAQVRTATRIQPTITGGQAHWDGAARAKTSGKEYVVDLGDGYQAVYRPYAASGADPTVFSHRGALELIAPPGAGHGPELVRRLGQLNLVNRPMSAAEAEWTYLTRNIWAQQLDRHQPVAAALGQARGLEDAIRHQLIADRAHQAVGLDEAGLKAFAKTILLEAEARALTHKVRMVRHAVATSSGLAGGEALAATAGYDPTPRRSGGWLVWDRFDVDPGQLDAKFTNRGLAHRLTGNNLLDVLGSGVLACTERRRLMGVKAYLGMSEDADMSSGGAKSVFLRVADTAPTVGLYWDKPSRLLRRADWYAYNGDHFGSVNPASSHSTSGQTRNPATVAGFSSGSNEVMFRNGIDLLGAEAPSRIRCGNPTTRQQVLGLLAQRGITMLGDKPVDQVVTT